MPPSVPGSDHGKTMVSPGFEALVDSENDFVSKDSVACPKLVLVYPGSSRVLTCTVNTISNYRIDVDMVSVKDALPVLKAAMEKKDVTATLTVGDTVFEMGVLESLSMYGIFDERCSLSLSKA